jgi:hypothetical protein
MSFKEQDLQQMVNDLHNMALDGVQEGLEQQDHHASYHHEKDKTGAIDIIHWTIEGRHYKVDFTTFARFLGLNGNDHRAAELTEYEDVDMEEYQYMYLDGHTTDGQTIYLKPYFYVLNNILR